MNARDEIDLGDGHRLVFSEYKGEKRVGGNVMHPPDPMRVVPFIVALIVAAFLAGCATPPPEGIQITVSEKRAVACLNAGGCRLLTDAELADIQFQAYMLGQREALGPDAFDSHGCKRGAS